MSTSPSATVVISLPTKTAHRLLDDARRHRDGMSDAVRRALAAAEKAGYFGAVDARTCADEKAVS